MADVVAGGLSQLGITGMMPRVCMAGGVEIGIGIEVWADFFQILEQSASAVPSG